MGPDGRYDEKAAGQALLDLNAMARGIPFLDIGLRAVSDNDNLLAHSTDTTGCRQYVLHVKDLRMNQILPDTAERVTSAEWAADSQTLFYAMEDKQTKGAHRLWRMGLGGVAELLYEEKDALYRIMIRRIIQERFFSQK